MDKSNKDLIKDGEFAKELVSDNGFAEFILRRAEGTIVDATLEELAIFGFGNLEDAIKAYQERLDAK